MAQVTDEEDVRNPVDVQVGKNIRKFRKLMGKGQQYLADATGLTFQQIQKYEGGSNRVSASKLHEISVALNVPIMHFFEGVDGLVTDETTVDTERKRAIDEQNARIDSVAAVLKRTLEDLEGAKI